MYCKECGQEMKSGAQFCGSCGAPRKSDASAAKPAAAQPITQNAASKPTSDKKHFEYCTSYLTFYIKGKLDVYQDRIEAEIPNTLFNFIPLGSESRTVDVNQIVSPKSNFKVAGGSLVLGIVLALLGLSFVGGIAHNAGNFFWFLLFIVLGTVQIVSAFQISLEISLTSGDNISIPLIIFEKDKADLMKNAIAAVCKTRTYDTNTRIHTESSTTKIVDAINSISTPAAKAATNAQTCAKCGEPLPPNAKFCLECGSKVTSPAKKESSPKQGICASCGAAIADKAKFCPECGKKRQTAAE